jgi:hypothetical protein
MGRTACTEPQCLYSRAKTLLLLWAARPLQSLSACTRVHFTTWNWRLDSGGSASYVFVKSEMKLQFFDKDLEKCRKSCALAVDCHTFPGNSSALCLFMVSRIDVTCNESVWCDFVKQFTALRLVELFVVNLNSSTTINITWLWLRIKWSVTKSETTLH